MFGFFISGATLEKYYGFNPDVEVPDTVKTISQSAFISNKRIESILIPLSVKNIAKCAFMWCENLSSVTLPDSLKVIQDLTFSCCSALEAIALPKKLEYIGAGAFQDSGLRQIVIPDTVTEIGDNAFDVTGCLDSVTIMCNAKLGKNALGTNPSTIIYTIRGSDAQRYGNQHGMKVICAEDIIEKVVVEEEDPGHLRKKPTSVVSDFQITDETLIRYKGNRWRVEIPDGVKVIGKKAFFGNPFLREISMPDSVITIEDAAFSNCIDLEAVDFSKAIQKIGARAFRNTKLSEVILPSSVERVGEYAFGFCNNLRSVLLPDKRIEQAKYAFGPCRNLKTIKINAPSDFVIEDGVLTRYLGNQQDVVIPGNVTQIGPRAFVGNRHVCQITIPDSVTALGDFVFSSCPLLRQVVLPSRLNCIPRAAFAHCSCLTTILLPKGLKRIGESAFMGSGLTMITIPEGVTSIGTKAFIACKNLLCANIPASVDRIEADAFVNCPRLTICTPKNTNAQLYALSNNIPSVVKYTYTPKYLAPPPESQQLPGKVSRIYYERLTEAQKRLYAAALPCILRMDAMFPLPEDYYSQDDFNSVIHALEKDYPQLYWFISGEFHEGNLQKSYTYPLTEIKRREEAIEAVVAPVVARLSCYTDQYERAKRAFDWLVEHLEYDHEGLEQEKNGNDSPQLADMRTIYGAFCNRKVVCVGYAEALQYLLQKLGIESVCCTGRPMNDEDYGHAWTIAKINGKYYHMDATWNDSDNSKGVYSFFCVTEAEILTIWDRIEDYELLPAANDVDCNYYVKEGLYFETWNKQAFLTRIEQYMEAKKPRVLHFRIKQLEYHDLLSTVYSPEFSALMKKYGITSPNIACSRFGVFSIR